MSGALPRPLVSVIVPSFNQGRFIRATIESIMQQDYRPLEIVVVDGGSTDETVEVLRSYDQVPEVRWVSEPDRGVVDAVNKGFARARGEIAGIQSSDDYYLPGAIAEAVGVLAADDSLAFVYGDVVKVDADGGELTRDVLSPYSLVGVLGLETWIPQPSTFFWLALARQLGGWREEVPYAADTDLWLRMAHHAGARKLDRFLAARRIHDAQRDQQGERIIRDYGRMLELLMAEFPFPRAARRAAAAGLLLQVNRYRRNDSYWSPLQRLWRAVLLHPPLRARTPVAALVPGWYPLRGLMVRLLRRPPRPAAPRPGK